VVGLIREDEQLVGELGAEVATHLDDPRPMLSEQGNSGRVEGDPAALVSLGVLDRWSTALLTHAVPDRQHTGA
jgi:hypothetical protein